MTGIGRAFGPPQPQPLGHEQALTASETTQIKRASDLLDKALQAGDTPDPEVQQAQDILDRLTGEAEDPNEVNT